MIGTPKQLITKLLDLNQDKKYQIKEYKQKRNLDQNGKYWKLINKLSLIVNIGTEELHKQMLKDFSVRYQIMLPSGNRLRGIEYYDKKGTMKHENGNLYDIYYVYVPSHELNTKEFARLLKGLIEECEYQGIDCSSPEEKAELEAIING